MMVKYQTEVTGNPKNTNMIIFWVGLGFVFFEEIADTQLDPAEVLDAICNTKD